MVPYAPDEPNLVVPLAHSYNERGVQGYTASITNSQDQRKQNCFYEIARNSATGKGTLTLSKRPGITVDSNTYGVGTSAQDVYLVILLDSTTAVGKGLASLIPVVIGVLGGNIVSSESGAIGTVVAAGAFLPNHIDKTSLSNVENLVLQLKSTDSTLAQRVFFSTNGIAWTEITDGDFTAIIHRGKMEFMDGFAFVIGADTKIYNSDTNSLANWTATSFLAKQITQDNPVGLARLNNQILAFGDDTVEMFYNAGNTVGSPLGRIAQLHQRVGLVAPSISSGFSNRIFGHYYCTIGNRIFFVGRDSGGIKAAGAFVYNGQTIEKISSRYIDKILSEVVNTSFYSVNTVGHHGQKGMGILLTSPNATSQRWLMFYPDWNEWFEWTSTVFSPINDSEFFLPCGTGLKNKLYHFTSSDNWQDNSISYPFSTQFKLPGNGGRFMHMYGVDADSDTSANSLTVEQSIDDCVTFQTLGTIDMTAERKVLFRGGLARKRFMRLSATNARPIRIANFVARIS
jgi:hypothetical protein